MHICIPDTREVKPANGGSSFLLYNVHIDGLYHCSLRYKQLLHLHQTLLKKFNQRLPPFPPKKLLPLSQTQIEERRSLIEKYLQCISQDKAISNSSIFNLFLLEAQLESTKIKEDQVHLDIELVNGQKIRLQIMAHDSADLVLQSVCRVLGLQDRYHAYFCLCLCGYDVIRDKLIIKRRLSFFESPYITLQMAIYQQEQIQNVLNQSTSTAATISSNGTPTLINSNRCRCQSCLRLQSNATSVPLIGSSQLSSAASVGNSNLNYDDVNNIRRQMICSRNQIDGNFTDQYHHNGTPIQSQVNHHMHPSHQTYNQQQHHQSHHQHRQNLLTPINSNDNNPSTFVTHRILLRKSYWDPMYDTYILNDQQALNLLFIQTVYDIKHSLMFVSRDTYHQLESFLASDSKLEYILLARTLKYYNYVHFEPCYSDYPRPRTKVMISIGSKELNMRVLKSPQSTSFTSPSSMNSSTTLRNSISAAATSSIEPCPSSTEDVNGRTNADQVLYCTSSLIPSNYQNLITKKDLIEEEYNFKVPLIRCWRLTSLETLNSNSDNGNSSTPSTTQSTERRNSLSLFGTGGSSQENRPNHLLVASGNGGITLISALTGRNVCSYSRSFIAGQQLHQQQLNRQHQEFYRCNSNNDYTDNNNNNGYTQQQAINETAQFSQYELSFEYLVSKDTLKWITISSDQAIFISISLQGVVDELVSKRDGGTCGPLYTPAPLSSGGDKTEQNCNGSRGGNSSLSNGVGDESFTFLYRNGAQKQISTSNQKLIDKFGTTLGYSPLNSYSLALAKQRQIMRANSSNSAMILSSSASSPASTVSSVVGGLSGYFSSSPPDNSIKTTNHRHHPTSSTFAGGTFEISHLKKVPSPIINDAFEGVTNEDDL